MSVLNQNEYRSFLPRFYRLATVSVASNMMVPLAGLCDTAFLGHLQILKYLAGLTLLPLRFAKKVGFLRLVQL